MAKNLKTVYEHVCFVELRGNYGWYCITADINKSLGIISIMSEDESTEDISFAPNPDFSFSIDHLADVHTFMTTLKGNS